MSVGPYTLAELAEQEATLQFESFTNDDALDLGLRLVAHAKAQDAPVAISISRNGHELFKVALPGAVPDNDGWIARKSRVVQRFGHSSLYVRTMLEENDSTLDGTYGLDPGEYAAHGGALTVIIKSVGPVGIIVVSGLPQLQDHQLIIEALTEHLAG